MYVDNQSHAGMNRTLDFNAARLIEGIFFYLILRLVSEIETVAVGKGKYIVKMHIVIAEMHGIANFYC